MLRCNYLVPELTACEGFYVVCLQLLAVTLLVARIRDAENLSVLLPPIVGLTRSIRRGIGDNKAAYQCVITEENGTQHTLVVGVYKTSTYNHAHDKIQLTLIIREGEREREREREREKEERHWPVVTNHHCQ